MSTLLIIVILLLLFAAGADIMHMQLRWDGLGGVLGTVLVILLILWLSACCAEFCARVKFAFTPADVPAPRRHFPLSRKYHILHPTRRKAIDAERRFLSSP